jgi:hypothetical protein
VAENCAWQPNSKHRLKTRKKKTKFLDKFVKKALASRASQLWSPTGYRSSPRASPPRSLNPVLCWLGQKLACARVERRRQAWSPFFGY